MSCSAYDDDDDDNIYWNTINSYQSARMNRMQTREVRLELSSILTIS
jgi:hypothetical protein